MPDNVPGMLAASGAIVLAAFMRLFAVSCPLEAAPGQNVSFQDAKWGTVQNLAIAARPNGDQFEASTLFGRHRVMATMNVSSPGRYRASVETHFESEEQFGIELLETARQRYVYLSGNMKTGKITQEKGEFVAAGVDALGQPGHYRWWVDMDLLPGPVYYNLELRSGEGTNVFSGSAQCRAIFANERITPVKQ
jgi:hypothetical protein